MAARKHQTTPMKRNLECRVCFEDYSHTTKLPKSLLCGHTVCADCLKNILSGSHIKCPFCKKCFASTGSIGDLPTNFAMLSVVDSMCQDCRNAPKTDQCLPGHCKQELCAPCHQRHLQAFHSDYQQEFRALQAEITQLEASCSDSDGLNRMLDQENRVINEVNTTCDGLMKKIEKIRKTTIQEIRVNIERMTMSFLQWQKNQSKHLDEGKKIVEQSKKLRSMNEQLYTKCKALRKELAEESQQMPPFIHCSLNAPPSDITTLLPDRLDVSYSTLTGAIGSVNSERSPVKPVRSIEDYRSYTGRVFCETHEGLNIGVSQCADVIAFTKGSVSYIRIMSDQLESPTTYKGENSTAGKMREPWGIVISRNKIFVSDCTSHNIHVCDFQGKHLYRIGSEGRDRGQFRHPRGLAMDEDETLFVCDCINHRICCFTPDGSFIRQFDNKGDSLSKPCYIAASRLHDIVVVSDIEGNLRIFSHGGDYHRTICARAGPHYIEAGSVAIDKAGRIIVVDGPGGQLLVLDDSLHIVARMGSKGDGPGQLLEPRGIALTAKEEVLICDSMNNCIQIFSNNHNCPHVTVLL